MSERKTRRITELTAVDGDMQKILQDAMFCSEKVVLKSGVFSTGPLEIPSDTELVLEENTVVKFIPDFKLYEPVYTRWEGVKCWCMHPCLWIADAKNVLLSGKGTLDGSGDSWWKTCNKRRSDSDARPESEIEKRFEMMNPEYLEQPSGGGGRQTQFLRPAMLQIKSSKNVKIEGVTIINSPFWTIHPLFSEDLTIEGVSVINPKDAPNTDGIDIESCKNVLVENTLVDVGDDGIALKSGSGIDGIKDAIACENVTIRNCTVRSAHGGAVIGSETAGGINNIHVEKCIFDGTDRGVRIKTRRGRGGSIHDLYFENITMKNNLCPFVINMFYKCGCFDMSAFSLDKCKITSETPEIYNVFLTSCLADGCRSSAGMIVGLPERPIKNVHIKDCNFKVSKNADRRIDESDMYKGIPTPSSRGFRIRYARDLKLEGLDVECEDDKIILEDLE